MISDSHAMSYGEASSRWLTWFLCLLMALLFHGCHFGGHDEDLLRSYWPERPLAYLQGLHR